MKVHHLNCGTINAPAARLVCHVLLVETDNGLVLIDTGFGLRDCGDPARRLGPVRHLMRPSLRHEETAAAQIQELGFSRDDVRHIVITHFDCDHIGGVSDFPDAHIHVTAAEALGAIRSPSRRDPGRMQHGFAARNGLTAAALAATGYTGIKRVFERRYGGYLSTFGQGHDTDATAIYKGLGSAWETQRIAVKPYAAVGLLHAAIDAALKLRATGEVVVDEIARIDIDGLRA
jgi:glyoxylase-like metal-dependent hydrolase (beta-lactamase superfamily II)